MKELRNHGDEAARILQAHLQDGVEPPPELPRHFEDFMRMVIKKKCLPYLNDHIL